MNGRDLTLGIVAGLAVAGLARSASGSGNRSGRFRRIAPVPTGFTTSPLAFVRDTPLERVVDPKGAGKAQAGTGFYHVTTNLPDVLAEGRLKSRSELRAAGRQGAGLGGGFRDEAADRVSVGLSLEGAIRVMRATRMMSQAVHGQIGPEEAFPQLEAATRKMLDLLEEAFQYAKDNPDDEEYAEWAEGAMADLDAAKARVFSAPRGPKLYDALAKWEKTAGLHYLDSGRAEWSDEVQICDIQVGFTEPAERFARVRPERVGLLQLAARTGAKPSPVPKECELRFLPEDLALVGVWEEK